MSRLLRLLRLPFIETPQLAPPRFRRAHRRASTYFTVNYSAAQTLGSKNFVATSIPCWINPTTPSQKKERIVSGQTQVQWPHSAAERQIRGKLDPKVWSQFGLRNFFFFHSWNRNSVIFQSFCWFCCLFVLWYVCTDRVTTEIKTNFGLWALCCWAPLSPLLGYYSGCSQLTISCQLCLCNKAISPQWTYTKGILLVPCWLGFCFVQIINFFFFTHVLLRFSCQYLHWVPVNE